MGVNAEESVTCDDVDGESYWDPGQEVDFRDVRNKIGGKDAYSWVVEYRLLEKTCGKGIHMTSVYIIWVSLFEHFQSIDEE